MSDIQELENLQYKDALFKYAQVFNLKKKRLNDEKQLIDTPELYIIYARKSTEDDQRQVQSIDDQIDHCKKYAHENGLEVVEIVREEKSAKTAGKRPRFREMLDTIKKGNYYNSILAWHPDRLARNMKESGEILDMLDNSIINSMKFCSFSFSNDTAGKMTLSILFTMAKEFSDKLSDDTKRGIEKAIKDGKHCGSEKKGYYKSKDGYYRKNRNTFNIYSQAWEDYRKGVTQAEIYKNLINKGEQVSKNALSNLFKDPFYAGLNCYGKLIVDMSIDSKFEPMVTAKDFLAIQEMNRDNPRGWRVSDSFRPFNDLVTCNECQKHMTAGVSKGKLDRYLNLTCGSSKCKEKRRERGIQPVSNTIRGGIILKFAIDYLENSLNITSKIYNNAKKVYQEERNKGIKEIQEQVHTMRIKVSRLKEKERKISDRILEEKNSLVAEKFSNDCSIIINQIRALETDIYKLEIQESDYQEQIETDFPNYQSFVNFFKNIVPILKQSDDAYLVDQLVKLVFLNITVGDKKVLNYELNEPFKSYRNLKILSGVEDGT